MALEPAVQLEFHQRALHLGRARLALPDQLVDEERLRTEALAQPAEKIGAIAVGFKRQLPQGRPLALL